MEILGVILIGLAVGIIAKLLMPGDDPGGIIITTLLGIAGAFLAKFLGQQFGWYGNARRRVSWRQWAERYCCCFSIGCCLRVAAAFSLRPLARL